MKRDQASAPGGDPAAQAHRRWRDTAVYGLLLLSVSLNVVFSTQLQRAKAALRPPPFLKGDSAPPIELRGERAVERLEFHDERLPVLFYWLSPSCSWCELNLPNLRSLVAQAPRRYRLVVVGAEDPAQLAAYAARSRLNAAVYQIGSRSIRDYRFTGTPDTLLVSPQGGFLARWNGAYSPRVLEQVEKTLHVRLPGFTETGAGQEVTR